LRVQEITAPTSQLTPRPSTCKYWTIKGHLNSKIMEPSNSKISEYGRARSRLLTFISRRKPHSSAASVAK
ncbi:hypothetical protein Bpfe_010372, partial [Biomphalaria pfeifferi]